MASPPGPHCLLLGRELSTQPEAVTLRDGAWAHTAWLHVPVPLSISCVGWDKVSELSRLSFLICKLEEGNNCAYLIGLV